MKFKLGFSPCPNDTFIFNALVSILIDWQGLDFDFFIADVEELNKRAEIGDLDITKISYASYSKLADRYIVLNSGSALGYGNGPLVVSKKKIYPDELHDAKIATPGFGTTANALFRMLVPDTVNISEYLFSDIEDAILSGEVDAGILIHENRFTYKQKGLKLVQDLGRFWEERTRLPIPLGGIVARRDINEQTLFIIDKLMTESVKHATENPLSAVSFMRKHAQTIDKDVMQQHLNLFVNEQTLFLDSQGRKAIVHFCNELRNADKLASMENYFVPCYLT
ncbi:MAG: 1,4-dihydroxy-6-naphthoate synthase [Bacteroidales bacterium]